MILLILISVSNPICEECHSSALYDSLKVSAHKVLDCSDCHKNFEKYPHPKKEKKYCENCHTDVVKFFEKSAHSKELRCFNCHGRHEIISFKFPGGKIVISKKCATCHTKEGEKYFASIHSDALKKGIKEAPSCIDCHSEHYILPVGEKESPVYYKNVPKTCAHCHENKAITTKYGLPSRPYSTYLKSYHGIFLEQGVPYAANCVSCHGSHLILPASDERSSINPKNLPKTCSKCHPGADWNFTKGKIHVEAKKEVSPHVFAVRLFYTVFISILVIGFVIHIIFDFIRYIRKKGGE